MYYKNILLKTFLFSSWKLFKKYIGVITLIYMTKPNLLNFYSLLMNFGLGKTEKKNKKML